MRFKMQKLKIYLKLLKISGVLFYMKYIKVVLMAVVEIIADLYGRKNDRR